MNDPLFEPLPREEVVAAIERAGPARVPLILGHWWGEGLMEQYGGRLDELRCYPEDAVLVMVPLPLPDPETLPWRRPEAGKRRAMDAGGVLPDWRHLDAYLERFPNPRAHGLFDSILPIAEAAKKTNRYLMFGWWNLFFEQPWQLRGMENLLMDYYDCPGEIHRLNDALCRQYRSLIERAGREIEPDGFWSSDDLGNQRQLMMRPAHFREFLKPYYARLGGACRNAGMHFWLHSCGNNTDIMEDLIEAGVDVFHPVQKHAMVETEIARRYSGRMTFLAGLDVQRTLRWGTPEEVRREVRHLIDTFDRPDGGMCIASGNFIVGGTPFENIDAFLSEALRYGAAHRQSFGGRSPAGA